MNEIITKQERETLLAAMSKLLDEYGHEHTDEALGKIIDTWAENKADLIEAFKKHPKYIDGKFMIAFDTDYARDIDKDEIDMFRYYIDDVCVMMNNTVPDEIKKARDADGCTLLPDMLFNVLFNRLLRYIGRNIDDGLAGLLNEAWPNIKARANEKTTRVVNRILTYLNYNQHPEYNRMFARYADALTPITITRHTVLSINPMDYLTMSFGNSWASCHTIDKNNTRRMPNAYSGAYCSGTISYMLDGASIVFYTIDNKYNGTDYYTQPKINRQMYHYGEDKLVQGRLYPQGNDGNGETYTKYRQLVQEIISHIFNFPNMWVRKSNVSEYVCSHGTHYRDYTHFSDCNISIRKDTENTKSVHIGHAPICVECGSTHDCEEEINCCYGNRHTCERCGRMIDEDDTYWVGDYCYCDDCVVRCDVCGEYETVDNSRYIDGYGDVCGCCWDNFFYRCECCEDWHHENDLTDTNEGYICNDCLEEYFAQCERCGEWYRRADMTEIDHTYYCEDCHEDMETETEDESED